MNTTTAFLEQLSRSLDLWLAHGVKAMTDPLADLGAVEHPVQFRALATALSTPELRSALHDALSEILEGQTHSILVALDGGSALAEQTTLTLTDSSGHELGPGLHELFSEHLLARQRRAQ